MATLQRITHPTGVVTYQSPRLRALGVIHAFSTRVGGVSPPPFETMNLASSAPAAEVEENYQRLKAAIGAAEHTIRQVHQVHGCGVHVTSAQPPTHAVEADALVTDLPGVLLSVRVADCVPVLLASADGQVVAAVHAGWRGIVTRAIPEAVHAMHERFAVAPHQITAAVGPCISQRHFEVGEEVAIAFTAAGLAEAISRTFGPKPHIDLAAAAAEQLITLGVPPERIDLSDRCTYADAAEFYSHRRDAAKSGRMSAVIARVP